MKYWLVKSEPSAYSWDDLVRHGTDYWDGIRSYQARNNLKLMKKGDEVLFYHSITGLEVVGLTKVAKEAYQDPTTDDDRWVAVDLKAVRPLERPVSLAEIKAHPKLQDVALVRQSRLSVMPMKAAEFRLILAMAKKAPPA